MVAWGQRQLKGKKTIHSGMSEFVVEIQAYDITLKATTKLFVPWSVYPDLKILICFFFSWGFL